MSVATAITGGAGAVMGIAGGVSKFFEGRKMQRAAQDAIANFEWEDPQNAFRNNQVSTLGSDLQREELGINNATSVEALRGAGTRGLVGGLGRVQANSNRVNAQIAAGLDEQQKTIDMNASQDDIRIRDMIEKRQADELAGYGQMLSTGMGMKYAGIGDAINGVGAGLQAGLAANAMSKSPLQSVGGGSTPQNAIAQSAATATGGSTLVSTPQQSAFGAGSNFSLGYSRYGMTPSQDSLIDNWFQNLNKIKTQ